MTKYYSARHGGLSCFAEDYSSFNRTTKQPFSATRYLLNTIELNRNDVHSIYQDTYHNPNGISANGSRVCDWVTLFRINPMQESRSTCKSFEFYANYYSGMQGLAFARRSVCNRHEEYGTTVESTNKFFDNCEKYFKSILESHKVNGSRGRLKNPIYYTAGLSWAAASGKGLYAPMTAAMIICDEDNKTILNATLVIGGANGPRFKCIDVHPNSYELSDAKKAKLKKKGAKTGNGYSTSCVYSHHDYNIYFGDTEDSSTETAKPVEVQKDDLDDLISDLHEAASIVPQEIPAIPECVAIAQPEECSQNEPMQSEAIVDTVSEPVEVAIAQPVEPEQLSKVDTCSTPVEAQEKKPARSIFGKSTSQTISGSFVERAKTQYSDHEWNVQKPDNTPLYRQAGSAFDSETDVTDDYQRIIGL